MIVNSDMRSAIGREIRRKVSFPIDSSDIRRWAVAAYYPDPPPREFWDVTADVATPHVGIVAPHEFNPFAWMTSEGPSADDSSALGSDADGYEKMMDVKPPGLSFQLNGGVAAEYGVRMRAGDVITSVTTLHSYTEREGKVGPMLFTEFHDTWTNQRDEVVKLYRYTVIRY